MTREEAQAEATRRWRVHGGCVWITYRGDRPAYAVGIWVPEGGGAFVKRRILGISVKSWERAFQHAEANLARIAERESKRGHKPSKEPPGALPWAGDLFEKEKQ